MIQTRTCPPWVGGLLICTLTALPGGAAGQPREEGGPEEPPGVGAEAWSRQEPGGDGPGAVGLLPAVSAGGLPALPPLEVPARPSFALLPAAASVVPGLLLHGLGPLVAGDTHTAKRLFLMEGAGLGLLAVGGGPIVLTGASRRVIGPLYAVSLVGLGLFSVSALSNLYAAVSPAFPPGVAPPGLPPLELEVGYQHVVDEAFAYRHFASLGAVARVERVRLEALARVSPDDGNLRVKVGGAYRLLGEPEHALGGADGSALDVEAAALVHRFPTEGFTLGGGEVVVRGRYAMARLSPRLAGSFAEMGVGLAMQGYAYSGGAVDDSLHDQLLFSLGYGVYLGRGGPLRGEALLYYDHRKDDFPGGGIRPGNSLLGHFGLRGRVLLDERWGFVADVQQGSAWVGRLSLILALGGAP